MPSDPLPSRRAFIATASRWTIVLAAGSLASFAAACAPRSGVTPPSRPAGEVTQGPPAGLDALTSPPDNSIRGAQRVDGKTWRLNVRGLVSTPLTLSYAQVLALKPLRSRVETMDCVEGFSVKFRREGVLVRDVLARAGTLPEAKTVIFRCHDGYATSLPVSYFRKKDALLVFRENGVPLIAERGYPLEMLATGKWGYKWAKWIEEIELSADANYRGYWESRGYSNIGDRDKDQFGP